MMTIKILNVGGINENSSYEYDVYVNSRLIHSGSVTGHNRNNGWADLLGMIAHKERKDMEEIAKNDPTHWMWTGSKGEDK